MFHSSYGMLGNVCYRFQSPLAQFSQFSCTAPAVWWSLMWRDLKDMTVHCPEQGWANRERFFPTRQARMTQWYSKVYQKGKKDIVDGRNPKQPPGK